MPMNTLDVVRIELMNVVNAEKTGANIRRLIYKNGFTYKDIRKVMGFNTNQAIYKWMRGDSIPTIDNLVILADMFKCRLDDIIVVDRR